MPKCCLMTSFTFFGTTHKFSGLDTNRTHFVLPPHTSILLQLLDRIFSLPGEIAQPGTPKISQTKPYPRHLQIHFCRNCWQSLPGWYQPVQSSRQLSQSWHFPIWTYIDQLCSKSPITDISEHRWTKSVRVKRAGEDNFLAALNSAVLKANQRTTKQRNKIHKIIDVQPITEDDVYEKIQDHRKAEISVKGECQRASLKCKTTTQKT